MSQSVLVRTPNTTAVTVVNERAVVVSRPDPFSTVVMRGVPGPPGTGGGNTYEHTQAAAAAVWTVAHNLARYPSVTVTDHFGEIIAADVKYLDENIVRVTHGAPVAGFAYLN